MATEGMPVLHVDEEIAKEFGMEGLPNTMVKKKARRGFAAMSAEKQKAIASAGGKAAHAKGTANEFTSEKAREAGRKGGQVAQQNRRLKKREDGSRQGQ